MYTYISDLKGGAFRSFKSSFSTGSISLIPVIIDSTARGITTSDVIIYGAIFPLNKIKRKIEIIASGVERIKDIRGLKKKYVVSFHRYKRPIIKAITKDIETLSITLKKVFSITRSESLLNSAINAFDISSRLGYTKGSALIIDVSSTNTKIIIIVIRG